MKLPAVLRNLRPSGRAVVWVLIAGAIAYVLGLAYGPRWVGSGSRADRTRTVHTMVVDPRCDPTRVVCTAFHNDLRFRVRMSGDARPLEPFDVQVRFLTPVQSPPARVFVEFTMEGMDMGSNRYALQSAGGQRWQGEVRLPACTSGRTDWRVLVKVRRQDREYRARYSLGLGGAAR